MITKGPEPFVRTLQRGCLSPESLELKQGAVVMFTKNDPAGRYVNGTLGVVDDFDAEDGYPDGADARRQAHSGRALEMEDRRERQGASEHHPGAAQARLGDDRA